MSFWKSLFGGGASESEVKASAPVEYNGFMIQAAPYKAEGQYRPPVSSRRTSAG